MTIARILVLTGLLVVIGCRSTPLKAPPDNEIPTPTQAQWIKDYLWAKTHEQDAPEEACAKFQKLAHDSRFPENRLADLRSYEVCLPDKLAPFARSRYAAWLQGLALDINLKLAEQQHDNKDEIALAVEKSKDNVPESEKLTWIKLALASAQRIGDKEKIEELKLREYKIAPRLNPHPDRSQYLAVARDFRRSRHFKTARRFYNRVVMGRFSMDDKIEALKGIRLSYKNERNIKEHLTAARRLVLFLARALRSHKHSHEVLLDSYDAQVYYGRALWTAGDANGAVRVFNHVERQMRGRMSLAELYWLKGRVSEEKKNYAKVTQLLNLALREKFDDPDLRDKILWYSAWNQRRRGHLQQAIKLFKQLDDQTQEEFTRSRALFWLGQTLKQAHQDDDAKKVFTELTDQDPVGYYGLLAHRSLGTEISLPKDRAPAHAEQPAGILDKQNADWLHWLDEKDALASLLDIASNAYKKRHDQTDDGWLFLFKYYARAGLYMKLYNQIGSIDAERRKELLERHPELLFPEPWINVVHKASLQFNVPEPLIYAIMRQESAFDPNSRSLADAFGLMQLIPEIAEQVSQHYKIPYQKMQDLYQPETNILLGTAHLKDLLKRNHGRFILAVASYNANEDAIQNWMRSRYHGSSLEFIEEIPYEETRAYVRLVMRNLIFYSLLTSKAASIQFPAWVLKMNAG